MELIDILNGGDFVADRRQQRRFYSTIYRLE
jgi:hypothetical protein